MKTADSSNYPPYPNVFHLPVSDFQAYLRHFKAVFSKELQLQVFFQVGHLTTDSSTTSSTAPGRDGNLTGAAGKWSVNDRDLYCMTTYRNQLQVKVFIAWRHKAN